MRHHAASGDVFESTCDMMDVTSNNRPDTSWRDTDANGHAHQWYVDGRPATNYRPEFKYETPTLVWVRDGVYYDDEGEPHDFGHTECAICHERVTARFTADANTVYMPGIRRYSINGQMVTEDEFRRRFQEAR
jgi:hypothetical protein